MGPSNAGWSDKVVLAPFPEVGLPSVGSPSSVVFVLLVSGGWDPLLCCIGLGIVAPVTLFVNVLAGCVLRVLSS